MADKDISDDDSALFRSQVGKVTRIADDRVAHPRAKPSPRPRARPRPAPQTAGDMLSDQAIAGQRIESAEKLEFMRSGLAPRTWKKLKRGQMRVDAELDLHGMTVAQAQDAFARFLQEAHELDVRCVRIVHGKGFGSQDGVPVIKTQLDRWLRLRSEVLAFVSAQPMHGGTGALYVLLRR